MAPPAPKRFTGWHMFAILVAFFGVVFAVNFLMARLAMKTFGGEVVENSYDASQKFNRWLDEAAREKALGWDATATRAADGKVTIKLKGAPETGVSLSAVARHVLGRLPDTALTFASTGNGEFVSHETLPNDRWRLRITLSANGHQFRTEEDLR